MSNVTPARLVPIRTACAMFDVNPSTLRGWERRYGLIKPERGEGGQRGFGPHDLDVIRRMAELTRGGVAASAAAQQILESRSVRSTGVPRVANWRSKLSRSIAQLDAAGISNVCRDAEAELDYARTVEEVIFPELQRLGETWHNNVTTIAQEHLATLCVRSYLTEKYVSSTRETSVPRRAPAIVLACVPEEQHDLPVLHVATLLATTGAVRTTVLAAGLPLEEILAIADTKRAALLLLSGTMPVTAAQLREWVRQIQDAGWENGCVLAGSAFLNSRIFSETKLRAAAGSYAQAMALLLELSGAVKP